MTRLALDLLEEHDGLAHQEPVLGAAKRKGVDSGIVRDCFEGNVEKRGGVEDPRPVHVQEQRV